MNDGIAKKISYTALFCALIVICSWISVPVSSGIAFTLQTFAVLLAAQLLGWKYGTAAVAAYIALGAAGLPVFSGFRGGVGVIAGVTGGYIVGFIFVALIVGISKKLFGSKTLPSIISMTLGVVVCYAFGTAWFCVVYSGETTFLAALASCVLPYLPFDALKIAAAVLLTRRLEKYVKI